MNRIPVAAPDLSGNEEKYVVDAIRSTWISSAGRYVDDFERDFAKFAGRRAAITVCNGTIALHLALLGFNVRPGDEVLVPSLTYVATANAVRYVGAKPVFVDVDPHTWCIDPTQLEDCITSRTRGIIAVHLYGHPADMDAISRLANIHGLWVVEDAAEAHSACYKGRPVGSLSRVATFSFYGNKIITSGEGGALVLDDADLEIRLRTLRGQGMDPDRRYYFPITGYNFRLTNIACAFLCAQLERIERIVHLRSRVFDLYRRLLAGIPGIGFQPVADWAEPAPWLFCITVDESQFGRSRNDLANCLHAEGIETRPFFVPLHTLPPFRNAAAVKVTHLTVTEQLGRDGMNLPTYSSLAERDIERIAAVIKNSRR